MDAVSAQEYSDEEYKKTIMELVEFSGIISKNVSEAQKILESALRVIASHEDTIRGLVARTSEFESANNALSTRIAALESLEESSESQDMPQLEESAAANDLYNDAEQDALLLKMEDRRRQMAIDMSAAKPSSLDDAKKRLLELADRS